jgi:hypothetical protein
MVSRERAGGSRASGYGQQRSSGQPSSSGYAGGYSSAGGGYSGRSAQYSYGVQQQQYSGGGQQYYSEGSGRWLARPIAACRQHSCAHAGGIGFALTVSVKLQLHLDIFRTCTNTAWDCYW